MSHLDSRRRRPFPSTSNRLRDPFTYVDEDHMKAFEEALVADVSGPSQPGSPMSPQSIGTTRIRKVSAMSDFAPVNIKVNRRKRGTGLPQKKQEWLFILLRWPLLLLISLFIACEFGCYVAIRQVVNAKEWLSACQWGPPCPNVAHQSFLRRAWPQRPVEETVARIQDLRSMADLVRDLTN